MLRIWIEADTTDEVRAARLDPLSGTWQQDVQIASDFDDMTHVAAVRAADGALWAFWIETDNVDELRAARLGPGSMTWSEDIDVASDFDDFTSLAPALDANGALWAVWTEADNVDEVRATTCVGL